MGGPGPRAPQPGNRKRGEGPPARSSRPWSAITAPPPPPPRPRPKSPRASAFFLLCETLCNLAFGALSSSTLWRCLLPWPVCSLGVLNAICALTTWGLCAPRPVPELQPCSPGGDATPTGSPAGGATPALTPTLGSTPPCLAHPGTNATAEPAAAPGFLPAEQAESGVLLPPGSLAREEPFHGTSLISSSHQWPTLRSGHRVPHTSSAVPGSPVVRPHPLAFSEAGRSRGRRPAQAWAVRADGGACHTHTGLESFVRRVRPVSRAHVRVDDTLCLPKHSGPSRACRYAKRTRLIRNENAWFCQDGLHECP